MDRSSPYFDKQVNALVKASRVVSLRFDQTEKNIRFRENESKDTCIVQWLVSNNLRVCRELEREEL